MSERKINQVEDGTAKPAMTRLKELPEAIHTQVMAILEVHTYKQSEPLVEELVGFYCSSNILCRFRKWHEATEGMSLGDDRLRQINDFLQKEMPEASPEKLREAGVMFQTLATLGNNDGEGFVNVCRMQVQCEREQIRARKANLEERRFQESLRTKFEAGIAAVAQRFQESPEAMELFHKARIILEKDKGAE
jgi:hypothetical protein